MASGHRSLAGTGFTCTSRVLELARQPGVSSDEATPIPKHPSAEIPKHADSQALGVVVFGYLDICLFGYFPPFFCSLSTPRSHRPLARPPVPPHTTSSCLLRSAVDTSWSRRA